MIRTKRVYEPASRADGARFLVERLWARGMRRDTLDLDGWLKDVAPSAELRQWFAHDPTKWETFRQRYFAELDDRPEAWRPLLDAACRGTVTLLYSTRDEAHNNAVALKDYLERKGAARKRRAA
jgi:uncharacterized protein YeaO (DUF488 family)